MRSVTYSMGVSLDGYIVGPDGGFDWTAPDEEVFRFWIDEIREVGVHLLGRRLYETMLYWETADQDPSLDDAELEWAALWKPLPKVVFSTTLSAVQGHARLASGGPAEEIERLRAEPGEGDALLLRLEVSDTGIGIDVASQSRIFERFAQADDSIAGRFGGTGLGLALCKGLVGLAGGRLGLRSAPGEGSCFHVLLPVRRDPAEAAHGVPPQALLLATDPDAAAPVAKALYEIYFADLLRRQPA